MRKTRTVLKLALLNPFASNGGSRLATVFATPHIWDTFFIDKMAGLQGG